MSKEYIELEVAHDAIKKFQEKLETEVNKNEQLRKLFRQLA